MIKRLFIVTFVGALLFTENAPAQSFWGLKPHEVRDLINEKIMAKDLSNLPSAVIILAEKDDLRKDGQRYADRLISAGIPTNVYVQWGIGHLAGNGARASLLASESLDVAVTALRGVFFRDSLK